MTSIEPTALDPFIGSEDALRRVRENHEAVTQTTRDARRPARRLLGEERREAVLPQDPEPFVAEDITTLRLMRARTDAGEYRAALRFQIQRYLDRLADRDRLDHVETVEKLQHYLDALREDLVAR